jgi:type I restriction enzyme S subunit
MERYDSYKDSGVKWLGEIPRHWEVVKLKSLCKMFGRIGFRGYSRDDLVDKGEGAITLSPSNFSDGHLDFSNSSYLSWSKYYESPEIMVQNGDIVFVKTASIGKVAYVENLPVETTVNPQILVFKEIKCNAKFLSYYLQSKKIQGWIIASANGSTISTISQVSVGNYPVILPTQKVQEALVGYIDIEISKIDAAIAQQQKMIDLLNERKQIIINNAVTKGLDSNVKMKSSGIDWIGEIPEHWELSQLKKVAKIILGKMLSKEQGNVYPYLCAKDVHYGSVDVSDLKTMNFSENEKQMYEVQNGDMLIVEGGAGAGGCAIFESKETGIYIQNSIMIVRGSKSMHNGYICYMIQSMNQRGYVEYICNKATIPHFTKEKVGSVIIPIPPKEEQKTIVEHIIQKIKPIDKNIIACNNRITLLQERKQIIINDVVTGKVKVV